MKPPAMLTRGQLSREVAHSLRIPLHDAQVIVSTIIETMTERLNNGEEIEVRGFGSFRFRRRQARAGRNPKTGMSVQVPPKKLVFFRPGFELRSGLIEDRFLHPSPAPETDPAPGTGDSSRRATGCEEASVQAEEENDGTSATQEYKPSPCCGPFAYQKKRFTALSRRIAELMADRGSTRTLDRALKDQARIQSWLAVHHHPSPRKSD
jgi:nucleoid DNA-binding protein